MKIDTSEMILSSTNGEQVEQESRTKWKVELDGRWLGFDDLYAEQKQAFSPVMTASATPVHADSGLKPLARGAANEEMVRNHAAQMLLDILDGALPGKAASSAVDSCQQQCHARMRSKSPQGAEALIADTFTLKYQKCEKTIKSEQTVFSAAGMVKTADGRQISLNLYSRMSRQEASESVSCGTVKVEKLKDPLVVNLDGKGVRLTDDRFAFNLDGNGVMEKIPSLAPGSGFLALDANGNGCVDSGLELFGTQSGNGFADLAAWDDDHNGWIDENDSVFDKLRIWRGGESGQPLETLAQSGVGAIYLGSAGSEFTLKGMGNELLGKVRDTGVFLREDGTTGMMQQIDLAV
ncbi:MAG TPA: hypothetical protein VMV75_11000 [Sulfuricella sp.]|nr:hypothetical protein [Sulfuricella sp.]